MEQKDIKANVIYYTTKYEVLEQVVDKTDEIKNNDMLKSQFIARLGVYITNRSGMVLVSFGEDKKLNGCMVISRHLDKFGEYLYVDFAWINPKCRYLRKTYEKEIFGTCKMKGIKRIQGRTSRGFKAVGKLYQAKEIARILEIDLTKKGDYVNELKNTK